MKKILRFLSLPVTLTVLVPLIMMLCLLGAEIGLTISQQIASAIYIFLGGYLFSKIEDKKIKIASAIFTVIIFICFGFYVIYACRVSCQGGFSGMFLLPITYIDYFQEESLLSNALLVVTAPAPVLLSYIASKLFEHKSKWTKAIAILTAIIIIATGVFNIITVLKSNYQSGYSMNGDQKYFDVKGNEYENEEDIIYYDREGNEYSIVGVPTDETDCTEGLNITSYSIVDKDGNKIVLDDFDDDVDVYLSADGYIYIDKHNEITYREDLPEDALSDWDHCDKDGNIYGDLWDPYTYHFYRDGTPHCDMGDEYRTND